MLYRLRFPQLLLIVAIVAFLAVMLPGCATTSAQFNSQVATAERSVQLVQTSATQLLRAQRITRADDQRIQQRLEVAHDSLKTAKRVQANDPAGAAAELAKAQTILADLKKQTGVQE